MELEWRTLQALELRDKNKMLTNIETFQPNDLVYLLTPYSSSLQSKAQKFRQDYIGPLAIDTKLDDTHYLLKDVTGQERLIRSHSSARFSFELSGNSN